MSFHQERHLYLALTKSELSITDSQAPAGDMALELADVTGLKEKGKSDGSLRDENWRVSSAKLIWCWLDWIVPESCFKHLKGCSRAFDFLSKVIGGAMLLELQTNPCTLLFVLRLQQDIGRTRTDLLKLCSHFCISRDSEVVSAEEPRAVVKNFHRSIRTTFCYTCRTTNFRVMERAPEFLSQAILKDSRSISLHQSKLSIICSPRRWEHYCLEDADGCCFW